MKKMKLFLAFIFGLVLLTSCDHYASLPLITEQIEGNWLLLAPRAINQNSYKDPNNIFLEYRGSEGSTASYAWYRKTNGVYQTLSLNFRNYDELSTESSYKIRDTVYGITDNLYNGDGSPISKMINRRRIISAYSCPQKSEVLSKKSHSDYSKKFWTSKRNVIAKDSLITYEPKSKTFFISSVTDKEIKKDFLPLIFLTLMTLLSLSIAIKRFNDKDEARTRIILYILVSMFSLLSFVFTSQLVFSWAFVLMALVIMAITGYLALAIFYFRKPIYKKIPQSYPKYYEKITQIFLTAVIGFIETLLLIEFSSFIFALIFSLIILSPAIIVAIQIIIDKISKKKEWLMSWH